MNPEPKKEWTMRVLARTYLVDAFQAGKEDLGTDILEKTGDALEERIQKEFTSRDEALTQLAEKWVEDANIRDQHGGTGVETAKIIRSDIEALIRGSREETPNLKEYGE